VGREREAEQPALAFLVHLGFEVQERRRQQRAIREHADLAAELGDEDARVAARRRGVHGRGQSHRDPLRAQRLRMSRSNERQCEREERQQLHRRAA
jgi:hypothetical protein